MDTEDDKMQGGEGLSQIDLHAFTDSDEQKISKELLRIVEAIGDLEYLPNISESIKSFEELLKNEGGRGKGNEKISVVTSGKDRSLLHSVA